MWREDESSGGRPNQYNCADRESNRRHPDYGLDAISTRPCFHDKNLSHSTSLSLCLHIAPSLLILCQSGFSRYQSQFLVDPYGRQFPTKCRIGILPRCNGEKIRGIGNALLGKVPKTP